KNIKEKLVEERSGLYKLRSHPTRTRFIIGTELSVIKKDKGKVRKVHMLCFCPNMEVADTLNKTLEARGFRLDYDGRPILGITAKELLQLVLDVHPEIYLIPAHAWTPWFGIIGSKSGYDSLEEAFEELTPYIPAIETGLGTTPEMNW